MSPEATLMLAAFVCAGTAVLLVHALLSGRSSRLDQRIAALIHPDELFGPGERAPAAASPMAEFTRMTLPRMGSALLPHGDEERTLLKMRLVHAGYYGRQAPLIFLGIKLLLMLAPVLIGALLAAVGLLPLRPSVLGGACLSILGMIVPSLMLDAAKGARQDQFRRALPDALDMLVICLEGGLSLPGALKRVAGELRTAHPVLAQEIHLVQREMQLGRTPGEALQQMALRTDLEEVRSLASVIAQAERFGASLVRSLRVHADTMRTKRQQRAETMAQKAAVKVLFPTLLFIFPAIFVVILGPAVFRIVEMFGGMGR